MDIKERFNYGKNLELEGNYIMHGAGQSLTAYKEYCDAVNEYKPKIYMTYVGLNSDITKYFKNLKIQLEEFPNLSLIPQIGLSMTRDGFPEMHYEHLVANGQYDNEIEQLCIALKNLERPAFIRIGYEFNGHWNGYSKESYKSAWIRIVKAFKNHGLDNVATVWCYSPDGRNKEYMDFYPGEEYVDWWGIDCFNKEHFTAQDTLLFMEEAIHKKFPVMIGESTPRRVGVHEGEVSWNQWFVQYFNFIHEYQNIKAFCYINWEWSKHEMWSDWGDARIEENEFVRKAYIEEISRKEYVHGTKRQV